MSELYAQYGELIFRILLASLLGCVIGLERDVHGRGAGLRTHLLVSMGAAVFTVLSEIIAQKSNALGVGSDPTRIAAQVVSGIGFLGAGVILKAGLNVRGLTTAACLWAAAAVGMAAGSGFYVIAIASTVIALISLVFLKHLENHYPKDTYRALSVHTSIDVSAHQIIDQIKDKRLRILNYDIEKNYETRTSVTRLSILLHYRRSPDRQAHDVIDALEGSPLAIKEIRWESL